MEISLSTSEDEEKKGFATAIHPYRGYREELPDHVAESGLSRQNGRESQENAPETELFTGERGLPGTKATGKALISWRLMHLAMIPFNERCIFCGELR